MHPMSIGLGSYTHVHSYYKFVVDSGALVWTLRGVEHVA